MMFQMRLPICLEVIAGAALLLSVRAPASPTVLEGDLPSRLEARNGPFLVVSELTVPPGQTVVFEPGTVLLFRNFTGITVFGVLAARGTADSAVIFTSENNRLYNANATAAPAPYDWNGITVAESGAGSVFRFCTVEYSLFGINALTELVTIDRCTFGKNGKADFAVNGSRHAPGAGEYSWGVAEPLPTPATTQPAVTALRPGGRAWAVPVVRYAGLSLGAAGTIIGIWKASDYRASSERFKALDNPDDPSNNKRPTIAVEWEEARRKKNGDFAAMLTGFGIAVAGMAGFGISFFF